MNYLETAKRILADQLGHDESEIHMESRLNEDLGMDSFDDIEVVMAFEEEFDVEICDEEAERCKTVADIVGWLERHFAP